MEGHKDSQADISFIKIKLTKQRQSWTMHKIYTERERESPLYDIQYMCCTLYVYIIENRIKGPFSAIAP